MPTIIGITGHVLEKYQVEGKKAGMNEIIAKPITLKTFKDKI